MKTVKVIVSGRVTGVGFRYSAVMRAQSYRDLRGWIRNRDSRTVEAVVQGDEGEVEALVAWLRRGPPGARVQSCRVEELAEDGKLDSFKVAY